MWTYPRYELQVHSGGARRQSTQWLFDASYEDRVETLRALFEEGVPRVAFHRGDHGIEPITYVFGSSAIDAVERASELFEYAPD